MYKVYVRQAPNPEFGRDHGTCKPQGINEQTKGYMAARCQRRQRPLETKKSKYEDMWFTPQWYVCHSSSW